MDIGLRHEAFIIVYSTATDIERNKLYAGVGRWGVNERHKKSRTSALI